MLTKVKHCPSCNTKAVKSVSWKVNQVLITLKCPSCKIEVTKCGKAIDYSSVFMGTVVIWNNYND